MLWAPRKGIVRVQHNLGSTGSTNWGTSVNTGAAAGTKGTPAQIFAATDFDAYWVTVLARQYGGAATASQGCLDILIGAATEEVLIANLLMGYCGGISQINQGGPKRWEFPLYIPAGSRIAAQAAGQRVSTTFKVGIILYGGYGHPPWKVAGRVETYGVSAVPNGTTVTPGASGAEGSWVQITASTSRDHFGLVPSYQVTGDTTVNLRLLYVDLGIGAATEEQMLGNFLFRTGSNESMCGPYNSMPLIKDIPSASRLVMRASNATTNDGGYNGAIHALT